MATMHNNRQAQRAEGPATVLAIGTAVPMNSVEQSTFPDYYFRNTDSARVAHLKPKFERICENSTIKRRYIHLTEDLLKENPNMASYSAPSLNARQDMLATAVPMLAKEAAEKAIKEWGQPLSNITHLIFCTTSGIHMPGADFHLAKLLGLCPSVNRLMLYQQGCHGGGTALRMAKDLAENNAGARVLAVCSEITAVTIFRGPNETHTDNLVEQALFGAGAGAVGVGSDPVVGAERPLFQLVSASQAFIPDTEDMIQGHLRESGVMIRLSKDVPETVSGNMEARLKRAFGPLGITDWNSIFWIAHPGGPAILDKIESGLGLRPEKLRLSRHSLSEYGNVWSTSVLLIMDEMRKSSAQEGLSTTEEGLDLGVLFGFGPGLTVETVVLRSMPIN